MKKCIHCGAEHADGVQCGCAGAVAERSGSQQHKAPAVDVSKIQVMGHADRRELMDFIGKCQPRPKRVIVQHGDAGRTLDLASSLHKQYRIETSAPKNLETVRIK